MTESATAAPTQRPGMGAVPFEGGVSFRVWAPHATGVFVTGDFNDWHGRSHPLGAEEGGYWSIEVPGAKAGQEYQYVIAREDGDDLWRIDPYARQVTNSVGNGVIYDHSVFDWTGDEFDTPVWDDLVIYELHIGTFAAEGHERGTFEKARQRLGYLEKLGVSAVHVMPVFEFAGNQSWGYNPAHPFAIESSYGGPDAFKAFVKDAHQHGIAVILDVVLNHLGPSDLSIWQFDGWSENDKGGIYFYNDHRSSTPWGDTRPDYGRPEVRAYLRDCVVQWLEDFHVDGLRFDAVNYIRTIDGISHAEENQLADGWSFLQWLSDEIDARQPWKFTIAEDLQRLSAIVQPTSEGGAGFSAQWDADFVHTIRAGIIASHDDDRHINTLAEAIRGPEGALWTSRVLYTESHDEIANGQARVPESIHPGDADSWWAKKRSMIGSALVMTSPGVPLIFQGQEMLEDSYFRDDAWLDWSKADTNSGLVELHRHLISLRRNRDNRTGGLRGQGLGIIRIDETRKVLVMHRFHRSGPGDDVIVAVNFTDQPVEDYAVGFPAPGLWAVQLNSDAGMYAADFGSHEVWDVTAGGGPMDRCEQSATLALGPYSFVIFSREE
ncbi:MAG: alpha-amylase family glycosyl hydrolase [Dermatophilaceae bacterium]|nr:alpha amylase C-terminal domain-containing protein [Intrasporangiaceae bacterium]